MAEIIKMPRLSDTMEEGNIVGWLKKVGDKVAPGDILAEVETDKATMELESFYTGTLLHIGVQEGPVAVDGIIAVIGEEGEDVKALIAAEASASVEVLQKEAPEEIATEQPSPAAEVIVTTNVTGNGSSDRVKASPLAKVMASEKGIDLNMVVGSGDHGRVIKRDIENYIPTQAPQSSVKQFSTDLSESFTETPNSQMRKIIAKRLGESKFTAPHFYLTIEINMENAMAARASINNYLEGKISYNDLVVKACAVALESHPGVNASWMGDKIRYNGHIHIGVAVAVDEGLVVPVIKHANAKSLSQLNAEVKELAGKARSKKIKPEEMQGNTFTISNLGMFGIEEFTAIINPPDACILAVGTIVEKPVVKDGQIKIGHTMKVTLSCDHRVVDGAKGSQFLQTVKSFLEAPVRILA